ncbi:DUF922 domain-containing protein [Photobacterium satsumensis]|uniref:DUF922 domain-containing protein n=1 Tax=Photobacterium satsumensis TaxID=2910239 RepID=UPI003D1307B9
MKIFIFFLVFLPLRGLAIDTPLPFAFTTQYEIYSVEGDIVSDIEKSFEEEKPLFLKVREADGYTEWRYDYWIDDDTCEIKAFSLEITYKLPQIKKSAVSPETTELYREYIKKLYRHEETHCALTVMSVSEMYIAFEKGQKGNCAEQSKKVAELVEKVSSDNERFDTYTNHGEIELAVSPFGEEAFYPICKIPFSGIVDI